MPRAFRRVVTGHDDAGRSCCVIDEPSTQQPGWLFNLWHSPAGPVDNDRAGDSLPADRRIPLAPAAGGSIFRICLVPPRSHIASMSEQEIESVLASLGASHARRARPGHRLMHVTETVDYVVVLQGRVTLHLDRGDVDLAPFDTVVQRGTSHAWSNPNDEWAALAVVLVGAPPMTTRAEGHD